MLIGKCNICESELKHLSNNISKECSICGNLEETNIVCVADHYLCDQCASKSSKDKILDYMLGYKETNPLDIAERMIVDCGICGNSPHPLITAAFLVAYRNTTRNLSDENIIEGVNRAMAIPGGWCGYYGACGAGISVGVAFSIINSSTPLTNIPRRMSNYATSMVLKGIAQQEGVRCCIFSIRRSIELGMQTLKEELGIVFPEKESKSLHCVFKKVNSQCNGIKCRYF